MKKIILGCAAVLLSLGLLAGCNNKEDEPPIEEAVVITVDSNASVVVGESLALTYTVSPEKAEVVAASDNEDVVTAVAQEGTLYLEGVAEGSAIVTLVGTYEGYASANKNINVSVVTEADEKTEPGTQDPVISITGLPESLRLDPEGEATLLEFTVDPEDAVVKMEVEDEEVATVEYLEPDIDDPDSVDIAGWYVTPGDNEGETTLTVTATAEGYQDFECSIAVKVHELVAFESLTLTVTLYDSEGTIFPTATDSYGVYMQSAYDDWAHDNTEAQNGHAMTNNTDGTYSYEFSTLPEEHGSYVTNIYAGNASGISWGHVLGTFDIEVTGEEEGEVSISQDITLDSVYTDWESIFAVGTVDETFYMVMVDTSGRTSDITSTLTFYSNSITCWSTGTTGTQAKTANNSWAVYSGAGTAKFNEEDWFKVYTSSQTSYYSHMSTSTIVIPSDTQGTPVFVCTGWFDDTWLAGSNQNDGLWYSATAVGWEYMPADTTIADFVAALTL